MTFGELLTDYFDAGFQYENDGVGGTLRANRRINAAYQELCALENWPFLENVVTGPAPLLIPNLANALSVIDLTTNTTLEECDYDTLSKSNNPSTLGVPTHYWLSQGETIEVFPVAVHRISVHCIVLPIDMATTFAEPIVPTAYQEIILLGAIRRGHLDNGDAANYQLVNLEWQARVEAMRQAVLNPIRYQTLVAGSQDD